MTGARGAVLGVISDMHWAPEDVAPAHWHNPHDFAGVQRRVRQALLQFRASRCDRVLVTGDVTHLGDHASMVDALVELSASRVPVLLVNGNHDCLESSDRLTTVADGMAGAGVRVLGDPGEWLGGIHVAGLGVRQDRFPNLCELVGHPRVDEWRDEPVLLVSHYPLLGVSQPLNDAGFSVPGGLLGREAHARALTSRPGPTIALTGHVHARMTTSDGPLLQLAMGANIEPPFDVAVVEIARVAEGLRVRRTSFSLGSCEDVQVPVLSASRELWMFARGAWVPGSDG